ncbi:hypothetical protein J4E83_003481 [Alternaria metachromatica]|uniref:uncharacterized protein n=1 Tax=Alternaria metachromatica TaxID=283354 RepID=UPI0020C4801A|nr:uncharacterized protein J4E83_003481 [Alternaria metachromatica]XP_049244851.1 uncharacterized protein J4E84_004475 [Alternaria hordeiaustralica]KAI4628928.1 hypothetical protein J4E83_003481 [Alternaria metachromatica]KAI4688545.1 hypothetical protein J4E84_004475 [Alternaria hordeiaustralica]
MNNRRKMSLLDTFRGRNGGSSTSFITTSNTGIMDTTHGSETDEEDNEDKAQEYLNKMTDDTNRKVETVFGKGVEVWKSFNGTIYADVNDKVKRKQRDEEVWGKKRKRGGADGQGKVLEQRFDSLRNSTSSSSSTSTAASTPTRDLPQSTYFDSTITYPSLPTRYDTSLPSTPTASQWENFPVRPSQEADFPAAPLEYKSLSKTMSGLGGTGTSMPGSFDRPIKPLPARVHRMEAVQTTDNTSTSPRSDLSNSQVQPVTPPPSTPTSFFGTMLCGARRVISGSFGSFESTQADRFDERTYRLLPGSFYGVGEKQSDGDGEEDRDANHEMVEGRPWLRKG